MTELHLRFLPAGDGALVVEFGAAIDRAVSDRVLALATASEDIDGVTELVPTFRSLLVQYDPLRTGAQDVEAAIRTRLAQTGAARAPGRRWRLPACYDPAVAPDLAEVAARADMTIAEVAALHSQTPYHVYLVGFTPGFAFMGDVPEKLAFPRRTDPRVKVPAGSVAIAQRMTGVYPVESPGGWHLIARCPVRFFDPDAAQPSLLSPGDEVLFEPVPREDYEAIGAAAARGDYKPATEVREG